MKIVRISIAVVSVILMLGGLFMIVNGSLEDFPTPEQIEKARISGIALVGIGACIGTVILFEIYRSRKKNKEG